MTAETAADTAAEALPWLAGPLADALRAQRGHALLVHGAEGAGQFGFALALARAWLCETPLSARAHGAACGDCDSCHLATALQVHPDLFVLLPEALHLALGWRHEPPEASDGKKKPSAWVSIEQVRAAIAFAELTRGRGRLKVIVIHPAERMQAVAASALLKLIEEPQGDLRIVLSSADAAVLLPTVRSRCQAVLLPTPGAAEAAQWLNGRGLADAGILLAASGGQPLAALERRALGLDGALWLRLPALVAAGEAQPLQALPVALVVESLQKLCHDAMLAACGAAPRYFPPGSVPAGADVSRLADWAKELGRVARHANHPWNAGLLLESLLLQGRYALTAKPPARMPGKADSVHSVR